MKSSRKKNFRIEVKKYRGLSEPTPIPAHIEVQYIPPAFAEGVNDIELERTSFDWVRINQDYMQSWRAAS